MENEVKKYPIHDKLYLGCIGDFGTIERLSGEVTSGNVSHLACQIRGIARRRKEYLMKYSSVKEDKDLLLDEIDVKTIARQEERERCIKAAQEVHCLLCPIHNRCELIENGTIGVDTWNRCRCFDRVNIRKAMEGGEL